MGLRAAYRPCCKMVSRPVSVINEAELTCEKEGSIIPGGELGGLFHRCHLPSDVMCHTAEEYRQIPGYL